MTNKFSWEKWGKDFKESEEKIREKAFQERMTELKKVKFPLGERLWCIECLDRLTKYKL